MNRAPGLNWSRTHKVQPILQGLGPGVAFHGGSALAARHAKELVGCKQVQQLQTNSYSGSLAFLAGWESLMRLDLRNSGELTDLDTLCGLPSLVEIRLRGSAMKRDTWPKALQGRLDFMSS